MMLPISIILHSPGRSWPCLPSSSIITTRHGVCHIVVLSWEASYRGVDVLSTGRQVQQHMIVLMEEDFLTLPLLAYTCAALLSTYGWMCAKGAILRAKNIICMSSAPSSRSFIVTSPVGLEEDTMCDCFAREKGNFQTNYWPYGSRHTPPIPDLNAWVVLIHVGKNVVTRGGGWSGWSGCRLVCARP